MAKRSAKKLGSSESGESLIRQTIRWKNDFLLADDQLIPREFIQTSLEGLVANVLV
jgi:hypothetical protein